MWFEAALRPELASSGTLVTNAHQICHDVDVVAQEARWPLHSHLCTRESIQSRAEEGWGVVFLQIVVSLLSF